MKHYTFPHLAVDANWAIGIVLYNSGQSQEKCFITYRRGITEIHEMITINSGDRAVYTETTIPIQLTNGEGFAMSLVCSDYVMPTVGLHLRSALEPPYKASVFPTPSLDVLPLSLYVGESGMKSLNTGSRQGYLEYLGLTSNQYLLSKHADILDYCFRLDSIRYHGKQRFGLGDCSTIDNSPPQSHQPGTHCDGGQFDVNYPITTGGYTHYTPSGINQTPIIVSGNVLNTFDHMRFMEFCRDLRRFFPGLRVSVWQSIKEHIAFKMPSEDISFITGDTYAGWNHDKHAHFKLV
jgi:hypothetical protein